jgi:ribonuclease HII
LDTELDILTNGVATLVCMDEVGRGALAGPVALGAVLLTVDIGSPPRGIRDSKLLSPRSRESLITPIREWATDTSVGCSSAAEIDQLGIVAAMGLAGRRAIDSFSERPDAILLDGNHDYLNDLGATKVFTKTKGDLHCIGIAAASILAKCFRDQLMRELDRSVPGYDFAKNKGYASPNHIAALSKNGASREHRITWNLPKVVIQDFHRP